MRLEINPFMRPYEYVDLDRVFPEELDADHAVLSVPLFTGTPSVHTTHRLLLLLLDYPAKTLTPIYTTGNFAPELCTSFNVQMSYKPGNPTKTFTLQPSPYNAFPAFRVNWDGTVWSAPRP
jgi:hypothetical protein